MKKDSFRLKSAESATGSGMMTIVVVDGDAVVDDGWLVGWLILWSRHWSMLQ